MGVKVREKPPGSGVYWIFVNHKGNRKSKQVGDKKLADKVAKGIEAKLVLGQFDLDDKPKAPTFSEYAKTFLLTYSILNHKHATIDSYKSVLDNHLKPVFGKVRLNEITRKDIKSFIIKKQNSGLAPNTVRIMRAYLSSVLTQAVDDELIEINPASNTDTLRRTNPIGT